jgi:hypothetical protein
MPPRRPLTVAQILAWCDDHHARTGSWPRRDSGPVATAPGETWARVSQALEKGLRGLPRGLTVARLLAQHRAVPHPGERPPLTVAQILAWADAHRARTGRWPRRDSGPVAGAPGEDWANIRQALEKGLRRLPGGQTLAQLLAQHRGVPKPGRPPLTEEQVVAWARAHHAATGCWPNAASGPVADAPGENWRALNTALQGGGRGLPGGSSLARLLARYRGHRPGAQAAPLTVGQILAWADRHFRRTGRWPTYRSGPVAGAPGEKWRAINQVLERGHRGLPRCGSLARLLREHRQGSGQRAPSE